jgi:hypothetical protein
VPESKFALQSLTPRHAKSGSRVLRVQLNVCGPTFHFCNNWVLFWSEVAFNGKRGRESDRGQIGGRP